MKLNVPRSKPEVVTHEGGRAVRLTPDSELRRTVMACLLWEDNFYESGVSSAQRITDLVSKCKPDSVASMAIEAREAMNLRHVPLLLCRELARCKGLRAETLAQVIQRPDELAEFMAIYWKDGRTPIAASVKKGLAKAFQKFNAYSLAKYNRDGVVKLRDVMFLTHPCPKDAAQADAFKQLAEGTLPVPDTWEVALSSGADKKATWERLLDERKLGALALLRNLRNMQTVGVNMDKVREYLTHVDVSRVLPFRFIAAARFAPMLEPALEGAMFRQLDNELRLAGRTIVLVDVSGSMNVPLSAKSDMTRIDAACGVAMIARELSSDVRVFSFSERLVEIPARRGFALRDAIARSQAHSGTYLAKALAALPETDRLIVISDEQCRDNIEGVNAQRAYMLNVSTYKNGVGYGGKWTNISGFSESVIRYIQQLEKE